MTFKRIFLFFVVGIIFFVVTFGFILGMSLLSLTKNELKNSEFIYGVWYLYDYHNEKISKNDFFDFKEDGSYVWKNERYGQYIGNYTYEHGYREDGKNGKFLTEAGMIYTVVLTPEKFIKNDNTEISENLKQSKYVFAIKGNGELMEGVNVLSGNRNAFVKEGAEDIIKQNI